MPVTATYDFDAAEHYRASREMARRSGAQLISWLFVVILFGVALYQVVISWGEVSGVIMLINAAPWVIISLFWIFFIPVMQRRSARKLPEKDRSVIGPQERSVDSVGYHSLGNGVRIDVPWAVMHHALETDEFFLFYYNKDFAYYIPKRALSESATLEVRGHARAGLSDKARVR